MVKSLHDQIFCDLRPEGPKANVWQGLEGDRVRGETRGPPVLGKERCEELRLKPSHPPLPKRKGGFQFMQSFRAITFIVFLALTLAIQGFTVAGCLPDARGGSVVLATTTSLYDSGILDEILDAFEREYKFRVKPIPTGSGEALRLGIMGEADVLITHAPSEEERFMKRGYGYSRTPFLKTEYILVGPPLDPATVRKASSLSEALSRIGKAGFLFASRGDKSGTHIFEMALWKKAGINPVRKGWYLETGQGMAETLLIANEKGAYCLTDYSTYVSSPHLEALSIVLKPEPKEECIYSAIVVDASRIGKRLGNFRVAKLFARFLSSQKCKELIMRFKVDGKIPYRPI